MITGKDRKDQHRSSTIVKINVPSQAHSSKYDTSQVDDIEIV